MALVLDRRGKGLVGQAGSLPIGGGEPGTRAAGRARGGAGSRGRGWGLAGAGGGVPRRGPGCARLGAAGGGPGDVADPPPPISPVYAACFLDMLASGAVVPLLPVIAAHWGAQPSAVGLLMAAFAAAQAVGAPALGALSDRYGRKWALLVSAAGACAGFALLGLANSLSAVFLSRAIAGLAGGGFSVGQAYIADHSPAEDRAAALGKLQAVFGAGFIFGPALGAFLSSYSVNAPACFACTVEAINLAIVALFVRAGAVSRASSAEAGGSRPPLLSAVGASLAAPWQTLADPALAAARPLFLCKAAFSLGFTFLTAFFPVWAIAQLGLEPKVTGWLLAYVAVCNISVQAFLMRPLTERFGERRLLIAGMLAAGTCLALWACVRSVAALLPVLTLGAFASPLFMTSCTSLLTKVPEESAVGRLLGVGVSVDCLARITVPISAGVLLERLGPPSLGAAGATVILIALPGALRALRRPPPAPAAP